MLDHTSGMPDLDHADLARFAERVIADPERVWRLDEVFREDAALTPFGTPPSDFHYSNAGYVALGLIIESVTGQPVEEVFEERIVEPLGLTNTMLGLQRRVDPPTQHGWFHPDSGDPDTGDFDPELPRNIDVRDLPLTAFVTFSSTAGGGISSTRDLLKWGETLYGGGFLGEDMNAELRSLHHVIVDPIPPGIATDVDVRYGLGTMGFCPCDEDSGGPTTPILGHDGRAPFLGTMVGLFHDDVSGATVVVRVNVPDVAYEAEYAFVQEVIDVVRAQA
jgi:D-alanyl-D-alanine carboxypeptidase